VRGAFTLTGPDGTQYKLTNQGKVGEEIRPDGKTFILSDSGITSVNSGEAVQFIWDASRFTNDDSRLSQVIGPDGHHIVYSYDQQGNLVSARDLLTGDTSRYGYDAQGRLTILTKTGQPGSVIEYPDGLSRFTNHVRSWRCGHLSPESLHQHTGRGRD
jgi:YD repeat-containing protein